MMVLFYFPEISPDIIILAPAYALIDELALEANAKLELFMLRLLEDMIFPSLKFCWKFFWSLPTAVLFMTAFGW
jgi:hypothetical protein